MNRRNIVIAVVVFGALAVFLIVYGVLLTQPKATVQPRNVVIAALDIPARTPIVSTMVATEQKPPDQVEPDALADPSDAIGMIAANDIPKGAEITPTRLARPAPPPQGLQIAVGLRAITIPIDNVKGIAGLLQPGDHVDVLASPPRTTGTARAFAIVRDARVLAVGQSLGPSPNPVGVGTPAPSQTAAPPPVTATLLVTPQQANIILASDLNSTLRLTLRSPHEPARSLAAEPIEYSTPAPPAPPPATPRGLQVISGDSVTAVQP
jgi:pilus assembly protein CpaB